MHIRKAIAVLAGGVLLAACDGGTSCPTDAAFAEPGQNMASACTAPAPQQVAINVQLCEACSHTAPSCEADLSSAVATQEIFLDTRWEICTDNKSCSAQACSAVTCRFTVANGTYLVHALDPGGTKTFGLTVSGPTAVCSGNI